MKLGVRAHDFGRMTEFELSKTIKDAGFETVQLALTKAISFIENFESITVEHVSKIREEFYKNNLEISVLGCYIEPSILDKDKRLYNVEIFKKGIDNAKNLGVNIIGTETTHFDVNNESKREEVYQILKDSVLRMVEKAEKENIIIGIEPVAEHTLNTPELTRRLLDDVKSDKLKVIFDPVNLLLPSTVDNQEKIFNDTFELLGKDIVVVHMKDITIKNEQKEWENIGKGLVNYDFIFKWLKINKPNISLLREGIKMDSFKDDLKVMKSFI